MPEAVILDDLEKIRKVDKSDMLSFCVNASRHYEKAAQLGRKIKFAYPVPKTIVVAGMGGSAIGGELLKDWTRNKTTVPIEVCREYHLPAYADKNTLVITTSYSGETEETLSVFLEAYKRKCMIMSISSGGVLREFADRFSVPHLLVPSGMAPRATLPYLFMPLAVILQKIGLVANVNAEFSETFGILKEISLENSPEKPLNDNPSKKLASNIERTIPAVYGFGFYRAVAQRLKTQFNENSKNPAKWEYFPELNHNEIVGWEKASEFSKWFSVIFIRDREEPEEIMRRIEFTQEMICKQRIRLFEVWGRGENSLAKMSSVICVGDFASVYLAIKRGLDPTPVATISALKERLKRTGVKQKIVSELRKLAKT